MNVTFLYFAMLREHLGASQRTVEVPAGTTVADVFDIAIEEHPHLAGLKRSIAIMVNEDYAAPDHELLEGDTVAFIPPVSGGDHDKLFRMTEAPLDARETESLVAGADAGAVVTFIGTVRNHARDRHVESLEYEAYPPAAEKMLARVGEEATQQWPGVRIAIAHRYGHLQPGDASVVICTASAHRDDAYDASRFAISRIKEIVPIWKKEHYADGTEWLGSERDYQIATGRLDADS